MEETFRMKHFSKNYYRGLTTKDETVKKLI